MVAYIGILFRPNSLVSLFGMPENGARATPPELLILAPIVPQFCDVKVCEKLS